MQRETTTAYIGAPGNLKSNMYIVTFYSFKGGVGRTMALANTAYELARQGKRVLAVDFDLEAPGLEGYGISPMASNSKATPGLVEFILEYVSTGAVPDVRRFVYEAALGADRQNSSGKLWVMPAGIQDAGYAQRLGEIDWGKLYAEQDGFVLFEDLKAQWSAYFEPDYVLVDSRTGHTDVAGICTRQLPDAVILTFIPNRQNLDGLSFVAEEIRLESELGREHEIKLHYVASNVPYLDDEERILARRLKEFKVRLSMGAERILRIHRYDSLALLSDSLFSRDRPNSRLAYEYSRLARTIQRANPADSDGAKDFLQRVLKNLDIISARDLDIRIAEIGRHHSSRPDVMLLLTEVLQREGRIEEANNILEEIATSGVDSPQARLALSQSYQALGKLNAAATLARGALSSGPLSAREIARAFQVIRSASPELMEGVARCAAIASLSEPTDVLWAATQLEHSRIELSEARTLLEQLLVHSHVAGQDEFWDSHRGEVQSQLSLALIGLGCFEEAFAHLRSEADLAKPMLTVRFNTAIAMWGISKKPPMADFERIVRDVERGEGSDAMAGANFHQCIALAYWIAGEIPQALSCLDKAMQSVQLNPWPEFSCWQYLKRTPTDFQRDLAEMRSAIADSADDLRRSRKALPFFKSVRQSRVGLDTSVKKKR